MALIAYLSENAAWAHSFRYRDFRILWGSTLLHSLGMGMEHVALGWLVLDMTDSPFMVGVSAAARMAPFFLLGILSGAIADRVDRRIFLRSISFGAVLVAGFMALLLLTDVARVWHVIALALAMGSLWAFTMTVRQAYTYDIVGPEHALNGMSLSALSQRLGGVVGALVAGVVIALVGPGVQYVVVSACYAAGAVVLLTTRGVGQAALTQRESVLQNLVGYVQLLRQNRILLALMLLTANTEVFGFTHQSLLPVFAKNYLGVGAVGLGVIMAVRQCGGVLGLVLLANLGDFRRKGLLLFAGAAAFGLGQMAFSLSSNILVFVAVLAFVNACASAVDTLNKTLMQANVANEERGRAMGSWVLSIGLAPVGHLGVGGMAGVLGAPGALLVNGGVLTFVSLAAAVGLPRIRKLE